MSLILGAKVNSATGGTITNLAGYTVHTFTSSATFTPSTTGFVEALVVGGGAGGAGFTPANGGAGGGGAGATLYSKFVPVVAGVACTVTVGSLGPGGTTVSNFGSFGGSSIFYYGGPTAPGTNITAAGGGGGGTWTNPGLSSPQASGGGGGGAQVPGILSGGTGAGVYGLGFPGGGGNFPNRSGSGGGAGGSGQTSPVSPSPGTAVVGGPGVPYTIDGSNVIYSVGGPNCHRHLTSSTTYGSGGGGGPYTAPLVSGFPGQDGVVIIRYLT